MNALESIALGVISGVFAALIMYVIGFLLKHHIFPWYQAITYKGVDINGIWVAEVEINDSKARFEMTVNQRAHTIVGQTTVVQGKDLSDATSIVNLELQGNIWEGFVILNMKSLDRTRLSYSTSLLEVLNGGATLKGSYLYRSIKNDVIKSIETTWRRKNNMC